MGKEHFSKLEHIIVDAHSKILFPPSRPLLAAYLLRMILEEPRMST
jgi:hypothetical protein